MKHSYERDDGNLHAVAKTLKGPLGHRLTKCWGMTPAVLSLPLGKLRAEFLKISGAQVGYKAIAAKNFNKFDISEFVIVPTPLRQLSGFDHQFLAFQKLIDQ